MCKQIITLNKWFLVSGGDDKCSIFSANSFVGSEETTNEIIRTSDIISINFVTREVVTETESYLLGTPSF